MAQRTESSSFTFEASEHKRKELEQRYQEHFRFTHSTFEQPFPGYDILNPYDYSKPVEATRGTGK